MSASGIEGCGVEKKQRDESIWSCFVLGEGMCANLHLNVLKRMSVIYWKSSFILMVNTNVLKFPLDILCLLCRAYCPVIVFNHCFSLSCDRGFQRTVRTSVPPASTSTPDSSHTPIQRHGSSHPFTPPCLSAVAAASGHQPPGYRGSCCQRAALSVPADHDRGSPQEHPKLESDAPRTPLHPNWSHSHSQEWSGSLP